MGDKGVEDFGTTKQDKDFRNQEKMNVWMRRAEMMSVSLSAGSKSVTYWKNLKALTMAPELENSILRSSSTTEGLKT